LDGAAVRRLGPKTLPVPRRVIAYWADFSWYRTSAGHIEIGRGHRFLWRSHHRYAARYPDSIGVVLAGTDRIAFSYMHGLQSRLYVARGGGAEHAVGANENPLLFLPSGELVTWRYRGGRLVVRAEDGRIARVLAPHARDPQVDRRSGLLVFRAGGRVYAFAGGRVRAIADLRRLGLPRSPTMETLGHAVALRDRSRLAVLGYDGRLIASTALPPRRRSADAVSSTVTANAAGTAFAFTATRNATVNGSQGRETVYVLRAGERSARAVHTERLHVRGCGAMAELAWHGRWLLYSSGGHDVALIDTSRRSALELTQVVTALPGATANGYFDVSWGRAAT
jgi:hypothetical protein